MWIGMLYPFQDGEKLWAIWRRRLRDRATLSSQSDLEIWDEQSQGRRHVGLDLRLVLLERRPTWQSHDRHSFSEPKTLGKYVKGGRYIGSVRPLKMLEARW